MPNHSAVLAMIASGEDAAAQLAVDARRFTVAARRTRLRMRGSTRAGTTAGLDTANPTFVFEQTG